MRKLALTLFATVLLGAAVPAVPASAGGPIPELDSVVEGLRAPDDLGKTVGSVHTTKPIAGTIQIWNAEMAPGVYTGTQTSVQGDLFTGYTCAQSQTASTIAVDCTWNSGGTFDYTCSRTFVTAHTGMTGPEAAVGEASCYNGATYGSAQTMSSLHGNPTSDTETYPAMAALALRCAARGPNTGPPVPTYYVTCVFS
jgi:hypothetical protein